MTRNEAVVFAMDAYAISRDEAEDMYDEYLEGFIAEQDKTNARRTCLRPEAGSVALDTLVGLMLCAVFLVEIVVNCILISRL